MIMIILLAFLLLLLLTEELLDMKSVTQDSLGSQKSYLWHHCIAKTIFCPRILTSSCFVLGQHVTENELSAQCGQSRSDSQTQARLQRTGTHYGLWIREGN